MDYTCEGYLVEYSNQEGEVIMWVTSSPIKTYKDIWKRMGKAFEGTNRGKQKNYYAYNTHPELAKILEQGRAVLGYSAKPNDGSTMDMEITDFNAAENYVFEANEYKSMF